MITAMEFIIEDQYSSIKQMLINK